MKTVGYLALAFLSSFLLVRALGIVSNTLYGLHRWLAYNSIPGLIEIGFIGLLLYGIFKLATD